MVTDLLDVLAILLVQLLEQFCTGLGVSLLSILDVLLLTFSPPNRQAI